MDQADSIWNRAALEGGGASPGAGDTALAAALLLHSSAMSGGVLDAVETLTDEELDAAEAGYRWLHVPAASEAIAAVRREIADGALDDPQRASALEMSADDHYDEAIEDDAALDSAFRARLKTDPDAFSPV
ncbi:hypothetical protein SAMN04489867_1735 [Pedococcus dokdonensis]|uniref:Uncharacterized protein n=1 Tax=Pedococcus dokdonensis TaxID=443156 RepID=A0A1H0QU22_9MICO|nr:hypothetical protein [Pedococcus dokdonensis]SDP20817.1 hypothetical protein SAMN04489867_1735 [Pedococcus dokdonensis]